MRNCPGISRADVAQGAVANRGDDVVLDLGPRQGRDAQVLHAARVVGAVAQRSDQGRIARHPQLESVAAWFQAWATSARVIGWFSPAGGEDRDPWLLAAGCETQLSVPAPRATTKKKAAVAVA